MKSGYLPFITAVLLLACIAIVAMRVGTWLRAEPAHEAPAAEQKAAEQGAARAPGAETEKSGEEAQPAAAKGND